METPLAQISHECFPQPPDPNVKVWRYMDLGKFVWLLKHRKLYLPRVELLRDPHEGSLPVPNYEALRRLCQDAGRPDFAKMTSRTNRDLREATYVSCWTMSDSESEAMWRLYCGEQQGVAIQTSYERLAKAIDQNNMFVGIVKYIDFDREPIPPGNVYYPFMHKRRAFAHESEVRIVSILFDQVTQYFNDTVYRKDPPIGIALNFDAALIDAVYVHPYAQDWFESSVRAVIDALSPPLADRLAWSRMKAVPLY